jgi:hypothetical protein
MRACHLSKLLMLANKEIGSSKILEAEIVQEHPYKAH